jgi:mRNA-degrading endonuclease toxin of MazEF toxin-antitoxin module
MSISPPPDKGDVVLVDYPFSSGAGAGVKRRPAVVVQNNTDNARLLTTIIAMITSNTRRVQQATQLLIDISTPDGQLSGLHATSAVVCTNLFTIEKRLVVQQIGHLSAAQLTELDACLKAAFAL